MGELVPVKYRYVGNAGLYLFCIPSSGMAPAISTTFLVKYPSLSWRANYWLLLGINGAALICWVLFYFPPTFHQKHKRDIDDWKHWVRHFDYIGVFLFSVGFVVFLLGLSWGGSVYPWKSAAVISAIVVGTAVLVVFVLWECFAKLEEPLIPIELFKSGRWVAACVLLGLGAGVYYAFAIIWPMQAAVLYSNGDLLYAGRLSVIIGMGIIAGQIAGGCLAAKIGKTKYQCMAVFTIGGILLGCKFPIHTPSPPTFIKRALQSR